MKTTTLHLLGGLLLALGLSSCDRVDCPYEEGCEVIPTIHYEDSLYTEGQSEQRIVVIEDFTGHKCPNCPDATREIQRMKDACGDQLQAVAIHAGGFADPDPELGYETDFRSAAGSDYNQFFNVDGYPQGYVSRVGTNGVPDLLGYTGWDPRLISEGLLDMEPIAQIDLTTLWDDSSGTTGVIADLTWLTQPEGDYKVQLLLLESHIIAPQDDNGAYIANYEHNHVLRAGMNGSWGMPVTITGMGETESFTADQPMGETWVRSNCEVMAFVYNAMTYEIMQVAHGRLPGG